jgi:ABC-type nitrate/sulfonate/bicarbonate transport system permease component
MSDTVAPSPSRAIRWRRHLDHALVFAIIIALWSLATWRFGTYWVSSPWAVAIRFVETVASGELIRHAGYTLTEAAAGTLIGGVPAVLLPLLLRRHPVMVAILDPFMIGGYGAPKLAFAPLFIVWFGIGMESKIALVVTVVFFIVYFATLNGVRSLDPKLVQTAQIFGAGERHVARAIVLPAAIPSIFAGARLALGISIIMVVAAEMQLSKFGIGARLTHSGSVLETGQVFAMLILLAVVGIVLTKGQEMLDRFIGRWRTR